MHDGYVPAGRLPLELKTKVHVCVASCAASDSTQRHLRGNTTSCCVSTCSLNRSVQRGPAG